MSTLLDHIVDTFPANNDEGVPLKSEITITLSGLDYSTTSIQDGFFVEGPDTDQFVGPGQIELLFPDNISQGDLDDFLNSPGYKGIVAGEITVSGIAGNTVVTFSPDLPFAPLTEYIVNLTSVQTATEDDIDGFITFTFVSGSGSIETVPSTVSTSILSSSLSETSASVSDALRVLTTNPLDRSVENPKTLREISITFNKELSAASAANIANQISVNTIPVSDHPNLTVNAIGELAKVVTVDGKKLVITI